MAHASSAPQNGPQDLSCRAVPAGGTHNSTAEDVGAPQWPPTLKTTRACDRCRSRRVRCDPITPAEPGGPLACKKCAARDMQCTWNLPIALTRHRKRSMAAGSETPQPPLPRKKQQIAQVGNLETQFSDYTSLDYLIDASKATQNEVSPRRNSSTLSGTSLSPPHGPQVSMQEICQDQSLLETENTLQAVWGNANESPSVSHHSAHHPAPICRSLGSTTRMVGSTCYSYLLLSTSTFPPHLMDEFNKKYSQMHFVDPLGNGAIKLDIQPSQTSGISALLAKCGEPDHIPPDILKATTNAFLLEPHAYGLLPLLSPEDVSLLILPGQTSDITKWGHEGSQTSFLQLIMGGIGALQRQYNPRTAHLFRTAIMNVRRAMDVCGESVLSNVPAFIYLACSGELEAVSRPSLSWNSFGLAVRAAQDMGLQRTYLVPTTPGTLDTSQRIWLACIACDRWMALLYGMPSMITLGKVERSRLLDLLDSVSADPELRYIASWITISLLLGEALDLIYGPDGILGLEDKQIQGLKDRLDEWMESLPEEHRLKDPVESSYHAGFVNISYVVVKFVSIRPFIMDTYERAGLSFRVSIGQWKLLCEHAQLCIDWLYHHENAAASWITVFYSLFICALIQYHDFMKLHDDKSLRYLRRANDLVSRVVRSGNPTRSRLAEFFVLLEETAMQVQVNSTPNRLARIQERVSLENKNVVASQTLPSVFDDALLATGFGDRSAEPSAHGSQADTQSLDFSVQDHQLLSNDDQLLYPTLEDDFTFAPLADNGQFSLDGGGVRSDMSSFLSGLGDLWLSALEDGNSIQ